MYNHAEGNYVCPICLAAKGIENNETWIKQGDIFYRDDLVFAFVSSKSIIGNEGHLLIVPAAHYENTYEHLVQIRPFNKKIRIEESDLSKLNLRFKQKRGFAV